MKLAALTAFHVRIPLRRPIRHASHTREFTDNVVVRATLDDGTTGFGEGVPRDYVTGETIDSALELLQRSLLRDQLEACSDFKAVAIVAARLRLAPVAGDDRGIQGNAARCALELAVLDAFGQAFREPLAAVTRLAEPELLEPRDRVRYSDVITSATGFKLRVRAWMTRVYGFHQLKVKVGIPGYDDVRRLQRIRRIVGRSLDLRMDANEAWSPAEAAERIAALEPFGISSVEQPLQHEDFAALPELRRRIRTPIMLDESLCGIMDARRAVDLGACDLFNLRLSKCGGFLPSLALARFGKRRGLGYQLGCQVGETAILSAAGRHFAASVGGIRFVEGSFDRHLVRESLGTADITFGRGGWAPALTGPGLGIRVDAAALARVTIREVPIFG